MLLWQPTQRCIGEFKKKEKYAYYKQIISCSKNYSILILTCLNQHTPARPVSTTMILMYTEFHCQCKFIFPLILKEINHLITFIPDYH